MTEVKFYDPEFVPPAHITFSVITARFKGSWIFVRHRDRTTWEIPGGHIEKGESSDEAASRELKEETGAIDFTLKCVATYSVEKDCSTGYGRLYFAEVERIGEIPDISEIAEKAMADNIPENLTWADIQPYLFRKVKSYLGMKGKI
ncbi:MAG: NUDIX domain-containing protein [Bacteroidales bacterium]